MTRFVDVLTKRCIEKYDRAGLDNARANEWITRSTSKEEEPNKEVEEDAKV